ncbi:peptide deformylase [Sulfobacillus thermosulfidooxidans]|uniref:Peptide deformylase n=2 Tax=Sulfobacillus thermosulfidooxidans TaxID=28034 RepID=A0A1W1WMV9_SULTA|nr:peptide deformylase [Sulfobacillus thermosulfidooxidans]OLZ09737.1 peptide deformylase [Sulfobacillus thermosulfidooxidans]OLZ15956.1 peptide deformylase [Sulfobacillus thermosulfidooxidans]OLZ18196.1 peptide deformylase [Sulfobacillus thermosulfidooxidans]PSR29948.1 MAG: peptide deformylase [Sulfobacillus thermosulfidooxidans]SMC07522.1 peptide deformylase [Sulfobacillus thermosulfidooxidans DSM 9293]
MMEIRLAGDDVLRQIAKPVRKVNKEIQSLLKEMAETMYAADGIGLAAPQVGISKRVVVADVGDGLIELVNPQILYREGVQSGYEGCLSIPDLVGEVERAEKIRVTGLDRHGHQIWLNCEGLLARCLQHEIDHLDGILFTDLALKVVPRESVEVDDEVVLD